MPVMTTPGVYIVEKNAFPNSVVEVATAVPAFIGYTECADDDGKPLANKPWRITSMAEYHRHFGRAPKALFEIKDDAQPEDAAFKVGDKYCTLEQTAGRFNLYRGMLHFFLNGGGPCFVVSVGQYGDGSDDTKNKQPIDKAALEAGIATLQLEQEPTMVVIPDAVLLADKEACIGVQQTMLKHCGLTMRNRVALLDIYDGYKELRDKPVDDFRNALGVDFLDFAAAYYPFVHTSIVQDRDLSWENIENRARLIELLEVDLKLPATVDGETEIKVKMPADAKQPPLEDAAAKKAWIATSKSLLDSSLVVASDAFRHILAEMKSQLNLLPPSAAMAGLYTMVDNTRGVWKAPANVTMAGVVKPAVNITHETQQDLNVTTAGKSINAIRTFIGEGVLVWGARTLDGNSLDWRYINVRRTMIMLEQSCRLAAKAMVFEPNVGSAWVTLKSMIQNFLTGIWKRGGLAGATAEDAFSVHVGLGETMTADDILEGLVRVTVLVALSRPAEFIEFTFQQFQHGESPRP